MRYASFDSFLLPEECQYLIDTYAGDLVPSATLGVVRDGYRTASMRWIYDEVHTDPVVIHYRNKLSYFLGVPQDRFESPHIVRYDVGQEYKNHNDYFHPKTEYYDECMSQGGQRVWTAITYLNDNFDGGETTFPKLKLTVTPKTGSLFMFNNLLEDGTPDKSTLHAGLPVKDGVKFILITWTRENPYVNPPD